MSSIPQGFILQADGSYSKPKRQPLVTAMPPPPIPECLKPKRIRQDTKPLMNKLETEWFNQLQQNPLVDNLRTQALRFKLGNGIWYKPDMTCRVAIQLTAYEVKGPHSFRGGFENLKVAAGLWPDWDFTLVWKVDGEWKQQMVLP